MSYDIQYYGSHPWHFPERSLDPPEPKRPYDPVCPVCGHEIYDGDYVYRSDDGEFVGCSHCLTALDPDDYIDSKGDNG